MIKAVLFDMDGVLIDAKHWHYESLNKALNIFGYNITYQEHLVMFDGLPTKKKLEILSKTSNLPKDLFNIISDLKQIYTIDMIYTQCKPLFCHQRTLSTLKQNGYKICVCSNSIKSTIQLMMDKSNLTQYLDFYLSNQDVSKSKPDPEIYLKAINKLQLKPEECLICEDNDNGIRAAIDSGAHLLKIKNIFDINMKNIMNKINEINCKI